MPARNIFGWQKPCYLLGEGYTKTFKELMETTDWETYGTGKYEKCANCMAHCGYEPTAANAALTNPLKAMWVALRGVRTTGPMAPEINLDKQRPAQYIFSAEVQKRLSEIRRTRPSPPSRKPRQPRRLRSARLKSIPVETSARRVSGLRATPRSTLRRSMSPFGLIAAIASAGKARLAGSLMTRKRRERKPDLGGIGRGDMAFHVDGRSPGLATTARPFWPGRRSPARRPPGHP